MSKQFDVANGHDLGEIARRDLARPLAEVKLAESGHSYSGCIVGFVAKRQLLIQEVGSDRFVAHPAQSLSAVDRDSWWASHEPGMGWDRSPHHFYRIHQNDGKAVCESISRRPAYEIAKADQGPVLASVASAIASKFVSDPANRDRVLKEVGRRMDQLGTDKPEVRMVQRGEAEKLRDSNVIPFRRGSEPDR